MKSTNSRNTREFLACRSCFKCDCDVHYFECGTPWYTLSNITNMNYQKWTKILSPTGRFIGVYHGLPCTTICCQVMLKSSSSLSGGAHAISDDRRGCSFRVLKDVSMNIKAETYTHQPCVIIHWKNRRISSNTGGI